MGNVKGETKFIIKPIAMLIVALLVFSGVLFFSFYKINQVRDQVNKAKADEKSLSTKVSALESVSDSVPNDLSFFSVVLPEKAAVLYGLNQVKNLSLSNNVLISAVKTSNAVSQSGGVSKNSLSFTAEGTVLDVYSFLNQISKSLPLMTIDKVDITASGDLLSASVTVQVYSAEFPKKIPTVSSPVSTLSKEEVTLLKEISSYNFPAFIEPQPSASNFERTNPF